MLKNKAIAVIPARGGSKRIPGKNIIDFHGKPMITWTIEAALKSDCFDKVIVSTDDEVIAAIAKQYGAEVPFLRNSAADDITPVSEATLAAVLQAEQYWDEKYQCVVQLMANCPLRGSDSIREAFQYFQNHQLNALISAFKYGWMNPWWAVTLDDDRTPTPLFADALKQRSQDLPDLYCPTGAIWISSVATLKQEKSFYSPGYKFFPISWVEAVDIDDHDDLLMAKAVATQLMSERRG